MTPILTQPELDGMAKQERLAPNPPDKTGHVYQRDCRIPLIVRRCLEQCDGDLIEIGTYLGGTTAVLVDLARRYNRKVICLDNFQGGDDWKLDEIGMQFKAKLSGWRDVVEFHEIDAHTDEARRLIQSRRYAWAMSDDGHSKEAHVHELLSLMPVVNCGILVDDVYHPGVREAIEEVLPKFPGWTWLQSPGLAEDWLVKQ